MQTLSKEERLYSKILLNQLFEKGKSFSVSPFKIMWINTKFEGIYPVQMAVSVPKKNFKKAVTRNRIKRMIREAYRKNKSSLYDFLKKNEAKCTVLIIYHAKGEITYQEIESKIVLTLQRLLEENEKNN